MPLTAATITMLIPKAIRQYSMDVAPDRSARNLETNRCMQNSCRGAQFGILPRLCRARNLGSIGCQRIEEHTEGFVKRDIRFPAGPDRGQDAAPARCGIVLPRARKLSFDVLSLALTCSPGRAACTFKDQDVRAGAMRKADIGTSAGKRARALPIPRFLIQMMLQAEPNIGQFWERRP